MPAGSCSEGQGERTAELRACASPRRPPPLRKRAQNRALTRAKGDSRLYMMSSASGKRMKMGVVLSLNA